MKRLLVSFFLALGLGIPAAAHPHMFIDSQVTAVFDEQRLSGFRVKWKFDPMFTASIRLDYDRNRDGQFNEQEARLIEKNAFSNLKNYHYFITLSHGNENYRVDAVEQFDAWMDGDRLAYEFFVPYELPVTAARNRVKLVIFDDTFFCDIAYEDDNSVSIEGLEFVSAQAEIQKNRDAGITYDPIGGVARSDGDANGQAYPYELYLTFSDK